jgi:zinc protease
MKKIITIFFLTALVLTCTTTSSVNFGGLGRAEDKVPLTSRAVTGKLPNGLTYFIMENSYPENRAHLSLVVKAGSVLEKDDERGFAHFVEHLAFNDTERFPDLKLVEYLRSLGMRFGPDFNASTSYDRTLYGFDIPVEIINGVKKVPDKALAIIDDWTHSVTFKPEYVASESLVVLEEHRRYLGATERIQEKTLPLLFAGSAYAQRKIIGLPEIIQSAASEQLKNFYKRWYTADNMALVFVGDFDAKTLEAELAGHFNMPAPEKPVNRPMHELPPPKNGSFQVEVITDTEITDVTYEIYYKQKRSAPRGTLVYYRDSIINYLIYSMLSMRFTEAKSNPDAASSESWGYIWHWAANSGYYVMGTQAKKDVYEGALRELLLEKEAVSRFGFTERELERAKLDILSYMEEQLAEKDKKETGFYIKGFVSYFLYGEDMADIEWDVDAVKALLPGIGTKEIAAAVKNYFSPNDCIVFLMAPSSEKESLPSKERIKTVFNETAKTKITQRQSGAVAGELLEKQPVPGAINGESKDRETGAVSLVLSNGTKVILKETKNKNNEVILYALARGGTVNAGDSEIVSVNLASEMLTASGLGPYSRTELINKLAGKQVSFSFWDSNYYRGFQGSSTTKDLKALFEMIHLFFTSPQFDERAVAAMIDQYKTNLAHKDDDPQSFFSREIVKTINSNHPRFKPLEYNDMEKVSVKQAFDYILKCVNPADYTFVFTGNFDYNEILDFSTKYIASIPNSVSMNSWTDPKITRPGKTEKNIYKGQDEKCSVYLTWFSSGNKDFSEERNQTSAVLTEYLDILLTDEIRENMSGVYSISAGASVSTIPAGENRITVFFQCSPARSQELINAVKERITNIYLKPLNQDTFNKSRDALLMEHEKSMQSNMHIAQSYANSSVLYNTPLSRLNTRPDVIKAVRPQAVQSLCRDILVSQPVQVVLFPEGW